MNDTRKRAKIEECVAVINRNYGRVLIRDCYEGYELKTLREALETMLKEVNEL